MHKPVRRNFKRNRVIVGALDQQWQMDLADMQSMQKFNNGYRHLLVCIDVLSKYTWVVPLKNKTGPSLVEAFKVILSSGRKPEKIMTDQGTELFDKHFQALMKEVDIEVNSTYNETKASVVERLIRTLKTRMWRYFTANKNVKMILIRMYVTTLINKNVMGCLFSEEVRGKWVMHKWDMVSLDCFVVLR